MKLKGEILSIPNIKVIPIVRDDQTIVFQAAPVQTFDEFTKICPEPVPPMRDVPGKGMVVALESKEFKETMAKYNQQMMDYLVIKSLDATEGLEWDTVDLNNPDTYENFRTELQEAGLSAIEVTRLIGAVFEANSLNEEAIDKARENFLAGKRQNKESE